jgi:thioredoxin-like negative regulator of GroEL
METLAKVSGSVDELVAIKARDLTYSYHYFEIVELLADAGRTDEALAWAERGIAAFPNGTDVRLRDVAARELHRVGRDDEAMSLMWAELEDSPTLKSYELL